MAENNHAPVQLRDFDPARGFRSEKEMAHYLAACLETGDMDLFFAALDDVIRAKGMAETSDKTGLGVNSLYKTFAHGRQPRFSTVVRIARSLGVGIGFHPLAPRKRKAAPTRARRLSAAASR